MDKECAIKIENAVTDNGQRMYNQDRTSRADTGTVLNSRYCIAEPQYNAVVMKCSLVWL